MRSFERLLRAAGDVRRVLFDQGDWSRVLDPVDAETQRVIPLGRVSRDCRRSLGAHVRGARRRPDPPLGYGAKTTLVDALAAGCHVIVHPKHFARLPRSVQPDCISWRPSAKWQDVARLVQMPEQPPQPQRVNSVLEAAARSGILESLAV